MRPTISIISECHSENLGDQAIGRAIVQILNPYYSVSTRSFDQIDAKLLKSGSSFCAKEGKSLASLLLSALPYRSRASVKWHLLRGKARLRWHVLGDKAKFSKHFWLAIQHSNLVILGGGQLIKNNLSLFCEKIALIAESSKKLAIPYALVGVGVDKEMKKGNWRIVEDSIAGAKFLILRDDLSRERMEANIGYGKNRTVLPDLAFALQNSESHRIRKDRCISLAVNVMHFSSMISPLNHLREHDVENIVDGLSEIVKFALESGQSIMLFTSGSAGDLLAANELKGRIYAETGIELSLFHPPTLDDLLEFLANVRDVLATRMHAGILAYVSGCNPLCINWDDKVEGVWSTIDQKDRVISIKEITRSGAGLRILNRLQILSPPTCHELSRLGQMISHSVLESVNQIMKAGAKGGEYDKYLSVSPGD